MDRRDFIKTSAIGLGALAISSEIAEAKKKKKLFVNCEGVTPNSGDLKLRFLGTGAAGSSGWQPGCTGIRRHSSALLDEKVLFDFTLSVEDMLPKSCKPECIFYTHSHGDHYQPSRVLPLGLKRIYVSDTWIEKAQKDFNASAQKSGFSVPEIIPLHVGKPVEECGLKITPLPGNHCTSVTEEQALIYLVEKGTTPEHLGVRLLYATDTGGLMGKATRLAGIDCHVSPGRPITAFIMEATVQHDDDWRTFNHSSADQVARIVEMLIETNRYLPPEGQPAYITHIGKKWYNYISDEELEKVLPYPLRAANDGLEVVFRECN